MWVQSIKCHHECTGSKIEYNYKASQFGHEVMKHGRPIVTDIKYGIGYVEGDVIKDRVCLDVTASHCSNDFELLMLTYATGIENVRSSGLVGLSPTN